MKFVSNVQTAGSMKNLRASSYTTDSGIHMLNNDMVQIVPAGAEAGGSLIEEEMTFEELSSKLGGLTGGDHRQFATEDSMGPAPNEHPMAAAILNNNTNKNNMAFNDVNSSAQISVCTPFDSWLDGG